MTLVGRFQRECDALAAARQTNSLAALAVTLLLVVVSLYLIDVLRADAAFQDCVLSGRVGCEVALVR